MKPYAKGRYILKLKKNGLYRDKAGNLTADIKQAAIVTGYYLQSYGNELILDIYTPIPVG